MHPIKVYDREHATQHIAAFASSPIREVMETGEWRTVRADTEAQVFKRLEIFRDRRIAELLIAPLPKGQVVVSAISLPRLSHEATQFSSAGSSNAFCPHYVEHARHCKVVFDQPVCP